MHDIGFVTLGGAGLPGPGIFKGQKATLRRGYNRSWQQFFFGTDYSFVSVSQATFQSKILFLGQKVALPGFSVTILFDFSLRKPKPIS